MIYIVMIMENIWIFVKLDSGETGWKTSSSINANHIIMDKYAHCSTNWIRRANSHFYLGITLGSDLQYTLYINIFSILLSAFLSLFYMFANRGYSWRVWLAKQETLTPSWYLVSGFQGYTNVRGDTLLLDHTDSASVILYFTLYISQEVDFKYYKC